MVFFGLGTVPDLTVVPVPAGQNVQVCKPCVHTCICMCKDMRMDMCIGGYRMWPLAGFWNPSEFDDWVRLKLTAKNMEISQKITTSEHGNICKNNNTRTWEHLQKIATLEHGNIFKHNNTGTRKHLQNQQHRNMETSLKIKNIGT